MTIKTPANFIPPANSVPGQGEGVKLYRSLERHIVDDGTGEINLADAICKLNDPNSGEALNVNVIGSSPSSNVSSTTVDFDSRKLVYEASFQTGFDTYNDWTCAFEGSLLGEDRTKKAIGSGNDTLTYDSIAGELTLTLDASAAPITPYVNESKTYIKFDGTGKAYTVFTGAFEHLGVATANTTTFNFQRIGSPPVLQENWNVDPLNGTGISGVTIDYTKTEALFLEVDLDIRGQVAVGFIMGGLWYYAHRFNIANTTVGTYSVNLPLRDQVSRAGGFFTRSIGLFSDVCGFVFNSVMDTTLDPGLIIIQTLSGARTFKVTTDKVERRLPFAAGNRQASVAVSAANTPILSLKSQNEFDGYPAGIHHNRSVWDIDQIQLYASGPDLDKACYISIRYNATLVDEDFGRLENNSQSRVLQDTSSTSLSAPGLEIFSARILTNQIYVFKKEEIFKRFRNAFGRNKITASGVNVVLNQMITIVATPMDATDTLQVAATIIGGEVG